jgi:N-hydroxyarylamine O-acetyltransferase
VRFGDERWLVDVGFGPTGPRMPVNMSGTESHEPGRTFRLVERRPGEYALQTLGGNRVFTLYSFELLRYGQADCEVGHFYSSKHPEAVFVQNLVVARLLPEEVRSLRNRDYWVMTPTGNKRRIIKAAAELQAVLEEDFNLKVTAAECEHLFTRHSAGKG